jgi:hypothetical protein
MRLVACLVMCLMPILVSAAQTGGQGPSDPQAYCVDGSAAFYPYTGEPCKGGYQLDSAIAEKLTGAWLPCQESSALQWPWQCRRRRPNPRSDLIRELGCTGSGFNQPRLLV